MMAVSSLPVALLLAATSPQARHGLANNLLLPQLLPKEKMPVILFFNSRELNLDLVPRIGRESYLRVLHELLDGMAGSLGLQESWRNQVLLVVIGGEFRRHMKLSGRADLVEALRLEDSEMLAVWREPESSDGRRPGPSFFIPLT